MSGTLEPVPKGLMTPKEQIRGYKKPASTEYSAASVVRDLSPVKNVKEAAEIQSMQEKFDKGLLVASRGGKSRRRKSKKSKKTKRRSRK